ncbi:MAG: histidine kinase, partial [Bacteroidota bacterium]|nr:histidine kinase [Bacteroidota bacterium]
VGSIREDHDGNMWFLSRNGLNMIQSSEIENSGKRNAGSSQTPLFKNYLLSDGFLGVGSDYNTLTIAKDGKIWAGAVDRLTSYNAEKDIPDSIPPNIQLKGISIFNVNIDWLELEKNKDTTLLLTNGVRLKNFEFSGLSKWYYLPENLKLTYDNNYLTFRFVGITTKRTQHVKYQYFLDGLDHHWSSLTTNPEATYNDLPPGYYVFKVKAVNSAEYWSGEYAYRFTILPPWWKSWWAYMLYILGFAFIMWAFTWYRSRRLKVENLLLEEKVISRTYELEQSMEEKYALNKKVESQQALLNERLRISRELHDDIGSTLGSISIYSEVAKKRTEKNENTNDVLSKIGIASRELIDKMSDIVWSLNPNNESFEQLQNRMMAFAALILAPQNILHDFIADHELKQLQFQGGEPKNIFLIFKEALHNIVKYADCKNVHIKLSVQNNVLTMIIQDDGKGFDVSHTPLNEICTTGEYLGGNGIKNMTARAADINSKICISSKINEGTTVQLTVHL